MNNHLTLKAILKHKEHPRITGITQSRYQTASFHFSYIDKNGVLKETRNIYACKSFKIKCKFFAKFICSRFNKSKNSSKFPLSFKLTNTTPICKTEARNHRNNYRPVSILPLISKIFENIINRLLSIDFEEILSKFQCGFRKGFSTQHCLFLMLGKWKRAVDGNKVFRALLSDLSKTFDCIYHILLIAKLNAYKLSLSSLKLVYSCF